MTDRSGRVLFEAANETLTIGRDLSSTELMNWIGAGAPETASAEVDTSDVAFGPVELVPVGRATGPQTSGFAQPDPSLGVLAGARIRYALDPFVGAVIARPNVQQLETVLRAQLGDAQDIYVLDGNGRVIAHASIFPADLRRVLGDDLRDTPAAQFGHAEPLQARAGTVGPQVVGSAPVGIGDALSSAHHLLSLINEILDLSKVEAGRMEIETGPFSLSELVRASVGVVRERAARHDIRIDATLDGADLVQGDERKIKQVLFNLLSNAVKFTPDGGEVRVRSWHVADAWGFSVRDSGVGIPPEDRARIFEEFRQSRSAGPRAYEGTGLGLALSKRLVELHGGTIDVESEVGAGSTFTVSIPAGLHT